MDLGRRTRKLQSVASLVILAGITLTLVLSASLKPSAVSAATTLTVNTTADEVSDNAVCSLREAIIFANSGGVGAEDACGTDTGSLYTIVVPDGSYFDLTLAGTGEDAAATGDLDIDTDIKIEVSGGGSATVDANDLDRVFHVLTGASLELVGITVTDGSAPDGGGVYGASSSLLRLTLSVVSDNVATSDSGSGGGVYMGSSSTLHVDRTSITGNSSGDVNNPSIARAGGIYNGNGTVFVIQSTISNNSSDDGGGIFTVGLLTMSNSTVSGNTGRNAGAGIFNNAAVANALVDIRFSTITNNGGTFFGGGIYNNGGQTASVVLANSIVADQNGSNDCAVQNATITDNGDNLDSDGTCFGGSGGNANLGPLQNNGGPTETHALGTGSDAIDAGDNTACAHPLVNDIDQRGVARPQDGDGDSVAVCDIGAFELETAPPPDCEVTPVQVEPIARCLLIVKETVSAGATQSFPFSVVVTEPQTQPDNQSFGLVSGQSAGYALAVIGTTYQVTENVPNGWDLIDIDCEDSNGVTVAYSLAANRVTITFTANAPGTLYAICIFTNEQQAALTPSPSPSPSPVSTRVPQQPRPNIGGLLGSLFGSPSTPLPQATVTSPSSSVITPPSTGDGDLR